MHIFFFDSTVNARERRFANERSESREEIRQFYFNRRVYATTISDVSILLPARAELRGDRNEIRATSSGPEIIAVDLAPRLAEEKGKLSNARSLSARKL